MKSLRHLRSPFMAVISLSFIVALASCSKKEVVSDEPLMNPSDTSGGVAGESAVVGSGNAGEAGTASSELETVYFAFDSFSLSADTKNQLKNNIDWLKSNSSAKVQVEGHCDEKGTVEYNMALGDRRANAVKNFLVKSGIARDRIDTISYGKERPVDSGHDESAWSKNRRAVFILLSR
ncbi:MAG: peptidoglycan-associated lipoprotein Pal [Deltaproteobacteria bacterium]|nr:peptidoglycan-associated lipoprotein Pal [Deltaproteobacteria bacterium]MBM4316582.1 peptidoglycan-associated lipoprotein Pal [Deltaproteobacteria bacterium]